MRHRSVGEAGIPISPVTRELIGLVLGAVGPGRGQDVGVAGMSHTRERLRRFLIRAVSRTHGVVYRASGGRLLGRVVGMPVLLLTTTEYAILLGFLAIAIIIALFFLRNVLRSLFSTAAQSVSRAPN